MCVGCDKHYRVIHSHGERDIHQYRNKEGFIVVFSCGDDPSTAIPIDEFLPNSGAAKSMNAAVRESIKKSKVMPLAITSETPIVWQRFPPQQIAICDRLLHQVTIRSIPAPALLKQLRSMKNSVLHAPYREHLRWAITNARRYEFDYFAQERCLAGIYCAARIARRST